ncbi:GlxA family transcriptional regulator [Desulfococcaceae bacterium HSG8]|nr:GlxA family transcriptional regulator [Desulfococcaceae bacterium HSG8]
MSKRTKFGKEALNIMIRITFLVEENCMSSTIAGSIDAFSVANLWRRMLDSKVTEDLFAFRIVTADGLPVTANGGLLLQPHSSISEVADTDIIVIPAMFFPYQILPERMEKIGQWVKSRHKNGSLIASSCTGTFLLADMGLLDGKIATTNWQLAGWFRDMYPSVNLKIERIFTEDSGIYCAGAATAFFDLCLHFISKFGSRELYARCSRALLVDPDRKSQAPYILYDFWKKHADEPILNIQKWMEDHFAENISIDNLAGKAGISPRHFNRRFKKATGETPLAYLQLLRIENAKRKLETTRDNISDITWNVGYEDIHSFRRLFKKYTGLSPREYRNKFAIMP